MPQMAPLNWLTLMITFIMISYTFKITSFFTFMHNPIKTKIKTLKNKINWKW